MKIPVAMSLLLLSLVVSEAKADLLVSCCMSVKMPLRRIVQEYEQKTETTIRINSASSGRLALQIEKGAPVDLFISASTFWMNHLEMRDFIELAREKPLNIRFIEYMPFGTLSLAEATIPFSEMMESITALYELKPIPSPTSGTAGPAKDFHIKGFKGLVSFITPVTQPFCHKCNRLRITAQGDLKPCLLSAQGMNLKEALRNGTPTESMKALILKTLATKLSLRHPPEIEHMKDMASIGG